MFWTHAICVVSIIWLCIEFHLWLLSDWEKPEKTDDPWVRRMMMSEVKINPPKKADETFEWGTIAVMLCFIVVLILR